ncbi:MAG: lmo0937 family membrane protein [Candidatus Eisenbacteria bacterium]
MLFTLALIFMTAWILGLVTGYAFGGLLHFLLLLAFVAMIVRVLHRRTT